MMGYCSRVLLLPASFRPRPVIYEVKLEMERTSRSCEQPDSLPLTTSFESAASRRLPSLPALHPPPLDTPSIQASFVVGRYVGSLSSPALPPIPRRPRDRTERCEIVTKN